MKALADFYQEEDADVKNSDVEGARLDSGDFVFYWDDVSDRKMVRTSNTGEFIQAGSHPLNQIVGDNWKNCSLWMTGCYSIKNFRGSGECLKLFFLFQNIMGALSL